MQTILQVHLERVFNELIFVLKSKIVGFSRFECMYVNGSWFELSSIELTPFNVYNINETNENEKD